MINKDNQVKILNAAIEDAVYYLVSSYDKGELDGERKLYIVFDKHEFIEDISRKLDIDYFKLYMGLNAHGIYSSPVDLFGKNYIIEQVNAEINIY